MLFMRGVIAVTTSPHWIWHFRTILKNTTIPKLCSWSDDLQLMTAVTVMTD